MFLKCLSDTKSSFWLDISASNSKEIEYIYTVCVGDDNVPYHQFTTTNASSIVAGELSYTVLYPHHTMSSYFFVKQLEILALTIGFLDTNVLTLNDFALDSIYSIDGPYDKKITLKRILINLSTMGNNSTVQNIGIITAEDTENTIH